MLLIVPEFCVQSFGVVIWTWNIVGTFLICPDKSETNIWISISFIFCCYLILVCSLINSPLCPNLSINDFWKPRVSHGTRSRSRVSCSNGFRLALVSQTFENKNLLQTKSRVSDRVQYGHISLDSFPSLRTINMYPMIFIRKRTSSHLQSTTLGASPPLILGFHPSKRHAALIRAALFLLLPWYYSYWSVFDGE